MFVDVLPDTFNMDPASLEAAIALVKREGKLKPKAVMPVDLFGQPADYRALAPIAAREGPEAVLRHGAGLWRPAGRQARRRHRRCGGDQLLSRPSRWAVMAMAAPCFTNDDGLKDLLLSLRMHGQGSDRYEHVRIGFNSRLDTIQAAILIEKLKIFPDEIDMRNAVARRYNEAFARLQPHRHAACDRRRAPRPGRNTRCRWRTAPNSRPI